MDRAGGHHFWNNDLFCLQGRTAQKEEKGWYPSVSMSSTYYQGSLDAPPEIVLYDVYRLFL